jgi:hypothetical protein
MPLKLLRLFCVNGGLFCIELVRTRQGISSSGCVCHLFFKWWSDVELFTFLLLLKLRPMHCHHCPIITASQTSVILCDVRMALSKTTGNFMKNLEFFFFFGRGGLFEMLIFNEPLACWLNCPYSRTGQQNSYIMHFVHSFAIIWPWHAASFPFFASHASSKFLRFTRRGVTEHLLECPGPAAACIRNRGVA